MTTISASSVSSVRAHHCRGAVRWDVLRQITPGILAGGLVGSLVAGQVSSRALALFFALLVYGVGTHMLIGRAPRATRGLPGPVGMFGVGAVISGLSSLMAIGGAAMYGAFQYHLVRTSTTFLLIRRQRADWHDAYVDVRGWSRRAVEVHVESPHGPRAAPPPRPHSSPTKYSTCSAGRWMSNWQTGRTSWP